ncbi:hypothetical protein ACQKP1_22585 [Allorhizobium sp. NPDC080224]|uniref:hypothetical protein n=1 Tax=Allorhizobium sp. NPDC080224 TaxID=3390547 RepID=UPI003D036E9D
MMKRIVFAAAAFFPIASGAFAFTLLSENASPITQITQGHGSPGDSATSQSDPNVTFRVLDNGWVERTNSRYGSRSIIDPRAEYLRNSKTR